MGAGNTQTFTQAYVYIHCCRAYALEEISSYSKGKILPRLLLCSSEYVQRELGGGDNLAEVAKQNYLENLRGSRFVRACRVEPVFADTSVSVSGS